MQNKTKKINNTLSLLLYAVTGAVAAAAVFLLFSIGSAPEYYNPSPSTQSGQVHEYLTHTLAPNFYNNIQLDKPFEVVVPQRPLNEMLVDSSTMGFAWPVSLNGAKFSSPAVIFADRTIVLMGKVEYGILSTVVSITAHPVLDENGLVILNISAVRAGRLNITGLASALAGKIFSEQLSDYPQTGWLSGLAQACLFNTPWEAVFDVDEKTSITITGIEIQNETLVLRFVPQTLSQQKPDNPAGISEQSYQ